MNHKVERDILINSYYIIYYFKQRNRNVTNLKLQKLLYFLEAIYLVLNEQEDKLYDENFYAWDFGPVSSKIYGEFKKFNNFEISLSVEQQEIAENMNAENKKYINQLFVLFGDFTSYQLVSISHMPNSPWAEINRKYEGKIERNIKINKIKTRDWFKNLLNNASEEVQKNETES